MWLKCTFFLSSAKILLMNEIPVIPTSGAEVLSHDDLLQKVLENQDILLKNQSILLKAERNRRIWGIIRIVIILLLVVVPIFLLPMMMNSVMGGLGGGMNLDAILGNPAALEELLMGQ